MKDDFESVFDYEIMLITLLFFEREYTENQGDKMEIAFEKDKIILKLLVHVDFAFSFALNLRKFYHIRLYFLPFCYLQWRIPILY